MSFSSSSPSNSNSNCPSNSINSNCPSNSINSNCPSNSAHSRCQSNFSKYLFCYGTKMKQIIENEEQINSVEKYKTPLSDKQFSPDLYLTQFLFYHAFLILDTKKCYYSVEKNNAGILLQRSKNLEDVLNKVENVERYPVTKLSHKTLKNVTMGDLYDYIEREELDIEYSFKYTYNNCKGFADRVVKYLDK